jgi:cell division transport system permease protein
MSWLRMHAQAIGDALRRLGAQPLGSLFSILVLATAIALPLLAWVGLRTANAAAAGLDTEPHINVFLAPDASEEDARRVEKALRAHHDAAAVRFVSRTQAFEELKASTHLAELLAMLDRNPLPHAFTVRVRTTAADRVEGMRAEWSRLPKVDQVLADFEWAQRLAHWVRFGDRLLAGVVLALAAAMAFIVGHLIRLQILTRREEIEVSQLIGATPADVRRPFLYFGGLQGALAGIAAAAMCFAATAWIGHELSVLTPAYAADLKLLFLGPVEFIGVVLASGLLGWLGALLAVRREIRRFSDP